MHGEQTIQHLEQFLEQLGSTFIFFIKKAFFFG